MHLSNDDANSNARRTVRIYQDCFVNRFPTRERSQTCSDNGVKMKNLQHIKKMPATQRRCACGLWESFTSILSLRNNRRYRDYKSYCIVWCLRDSQSFHPYHLQSI